MKKRLISFVLAALMIAVVSVPAFAASLRSGNKYFYDVYGHDYYSFSMLNTSGNTASANVFLVCEDGDTHEIEYVPAGYMGINSMVIRESDGQAIS